MNYQVLARKCRPQSFTEVVGQEQVAKTLKNAILQNRIAHAFIFSGPRGVGKTSVARILAKSLNCEQGPTLTPCQQCSGCREITSGSSMDVREIDGASNRGIDEIRELRENVKFSPASSRYKIYIIDEVHMLTREAFNALLKTLEEPPAHVIFIFATTELHKIPATILSRCQCHEFRMISLKQIAAKLRQIAGEERIGISDPALNWIAAAGNGSLRDAQSIFDQVISYAGAGSEIRDADVEEMLGLADRRFLFMLSEALFEHDAGKCLNVIKEGYYAGLEMKYFYQMLLTHFRNLLFFKIGGLDASFFNLADEEMARLSAQTGGGSRELIQKYLDMLLAEEENMRRSLEPRLHLEATVVRMAYLKELLPLDEILTRMENLEKQLRGPKAGVPAPRPATGVKEAYPAAPAVPQAPAAAERAGAYRGNRHGSEGGQEGLWEDYKAFVKTQVTPLFWSKLEKGTFLGYRDHVLTIGFPKDYIFLDDIRDKTQIKALAEISKGFFGEEVEMRIEAVKNDNGDLPARTDQAMKNAYAGKQEVLNHPALQKVFDLFDGAELCEIVPRRNN